MKPAESPEPVQFESKPDISRPPKRLPVRTKGRCQTLPERLREDIIAREEEFDSAFKRYDGLGPYALEAEKHNTSLLNAVRDYAEIEGKFRSDPLEAVMHIWTRMGFDPAATAIAFAGRFAPDSGTKAYEAGFHAGKAAGIIEQFATAHPDFEMLRPCMAAIASADPNLPIDEVYSQAKWSDPITREEEVMKRQPRPIARNPAT